MNEFFLTLARPYAQAAFDFAVENQMLEKWELMLCFVRNIIQDKTIIKLLSNVDCIKPTVLADILILIGHHNFDCFFQNFIRIMAKYKRLCLLPVVFEQFLVLRRDYELVVKVKIIIADMLEDDQLVKIISFVENMLSRKIKFVLNLDPAIIGGFIIYINDFVIDGSIKNCIERLKNSVLREE